MKKILLYTVAAGVMQGVLPHSYAFAFEASWEIARNIEETCQRKWLADAQKRATCERRQRRAVEVLNEGPPQGISRDDLDRVRERCRKSHTVDYAARLKCETEEFNTIRSKKM